MKFCTSCGKEQAIDAVFCSGCGLKSDGTNQSGKTVTINTNDMKEKVTNTISLAKDNIQKSGYGNFFKETLIRPSSAIDNESSQNGWIHLILLTISTTFGLYMIIRSAINLAFSQIGLGSMFGLNDAILKGVRDEILPRLTLMSFAVYIVLIATAFLSLKIMTKSSQSFNQAVSQFGGLLTPNIILVTLAGLLSFLSSNEEILGFSAIIISFSLLLCLASYNFFLYKNATIKRFDKFYVLLTSNLLLFLILSIIIYIQIEPIIAVIENLNRY